MPKVSIILTSFNHEKFLPQAIDSALNQTFTDFELIIWDDCSTDNSWNVIKSYADPRIRAFRNEVNMRGGNVNRALDVAGGDYIAIHHSDDVWELNKLSLQVGFLDLHADVGAVFTGALAIDEEGNPLDDPDHFYSSIFDQPNRTRHEWLNHFFYRGNALCHPSVLIRKECYENCGRYRAGLAQLPDFDMWIRLCLKYEIHILPERLVHFRVRANEENSSGSRPDTRIRTFTESYILQKNYLRLDSLQTLISVFPQAKEYAGHEGGEPRFALAMVALENDSPPWAKIFGLELIFEAFWDPATAASIQKMYGFGHREIIALSAKHDALSIECVSNFHRSFRELQDHVTSLNESLARQQSELNRIVMELAQKDEELIGKDRDLMRKDNELEQRDLVLAEKNKILFHQEQDLARLNEALLEANLQRDKLEELIAQQSNAIDEKEKELTSQAAVLVAKQQHIEQLLSSYSWKVTAPLRKLVGLFK